MRKGILELAVAMAAVAAAQNADWPKIEVENGVLAISPANGTHALVKGELRAAGLSLQAEPGAHVVDVMESLNQCQADSGALTSEVSSLREELSTARVASDAALNNAMSTAMAANNAAILAMQSTVTAELQSALTETTSQLRAHTVELVREAGDNTSTALSDHAGEVQALFEEATAREAGVWEYTFSGNSANNADFAYWFSIDHGGQGAANSSVGVGDSYHCGNWFLEVEAKQGHCGGGCLVNYFLQRLYLNGYCSKNTLWNRNVNQRHGNSWSVDRVRDGFNGHSDVCHTFKVRHRPGSHSFGGPYWIKIRSTKPLVVLHSHPWGACTFLRRGINTGVRPRRNVVYESRNCAGHRAPPSECRTGTPAGSVLGIRTDPSDPLYNNTRFRGSCCVNGQNCPN